MSQTTLRRAVPDDCETLARLGESTFRAAFVEGFAIPYPVEDLAVFLPATYGAPIFAAMISDPARAVWLAEADGAPAGYAVAGPCGLPHPDAHADHGELKRLYVAAPHQGAGLGRALFELALEWMAPREGPTWIGVWSGNLKAQRFYARYGFAKVGEYEFPVGRWRDREFIMRRDPVQTSLTRVAHQP